MSKRNHRRRPHKLTGYWRIWDEVEDRFPDRKDEPNLVDLLSSVPRAKTDLTTQAILAENKLQVGYLFNGPLLYLHELDGLKPDYGTYLKVSRQRDEGGITYFDDRTYLGIVEKPDFVPLQNGFYRFEITDVHTDREIRSVHPELAGTFRARIVEDIPARKVHVEYRPPEQQQT